MIKKISQIIDSIYQNIIFKKIYLTIITSITILFFIILPFFYKRNYIFSSFILDILIRIFITYSCYQSFFYISHLDDALAHFYRGAENLENKKPGSIKKIINILIGIFAGYACYLLYRFSFSVFSPFLNNNIIPISIMIGFYAALPLISQFGKR